MNSMQKGFTLIELMIVVAIVGIMAAIAIPAYQNYITKAKATEAFAKLEPIKLEVTDYLNTKGSFSGMMTNDGMLSNLEDAAGGAVNRVTVDNESTGALMIEFSLDANSQGYDARLTGNSFYLTPVLNSKNLITEWQCSVDASKKAVLQYLPKNCTLKAAP